MSQDQQRDYWNTQAGPNWVRWQELLDRQLCPLGEAAMARLAPVPGQHILDIGCGTGQTSLALGRLVGETGSVLGVDISQPMLSLARERAAAQRVAWVDFLEADAQTWAFEPCDAVFSRYGVMFFGDPAAAFRNLGSALLPAGRLAFICWRDASLNPFMTLPMAAAAPLLPAFPSPDSFLPPLPGEVLGPGPFAFADGVRLQGLLSEAGFADIVLTSHDQAIGGGSVEEATELALSLGPLAQVLPAHPEQAEAVGQRVREALTPYLTAEGVMLASSSWIVTAVNRK